MKELHSAPTADMEEGPASAIILFPFSLDDGVLGVYANPTSWIIWEETGILTLNSAAESDAPLLLFERTAMVADVKRMRMVLVASATGRGFKEKEYKNGLCGATFGLNLPSLNAS